MIVCDHRQGSGHLESLHSRISSEKSAKILSVTGDNLINPFFAVKALYCTMGFYVD